MVKAASEARPRGSAVRVQALTSLKETLLCTWCALGVRLSVKSLPVRPSHDAPPATRSLDTLSAGRARVAGACQQVLAMPSSLNCLS